MYVVQVDLSSTVGVAVSGLVDGPATQITGLLHSQVLLLQTAVHDAIRVHGARAHSKQVPADTVPLRVHVVEAWKALEGEMLTLYYYIGALRQQKNVLPLTPLHIFLLVFLHMTIMSVLEVDRLIRADFKIS